MSHLRLISDYQSGSLFRAIFPGQQETGNIFVRAVLQVYEQAQTGVIVMLRMKGKEGTKQKKKKRRCNQQEAGRT